MNIIKPAYKWNQPLTPLDLSKVKYIVIHHAAAIKASVDDVHRWHQEKGWSGIGYNWYITKDGNVYEGRGKNIGAHVKGHNSESLGISVEGDYEKEYDIQPTIIIALAETINNAKKLLGRDVKVVPHLFFGGTSCCGKYLLSKLDFVQECAEVFTVVDKLVDKGIISSPDYWKINLASFSTVRSDYVRKLLNKIGKVV